MMVKGNGRILKSGNGFVMYVSKNVVDMLKLKEGSIVDYDMNKLGDTDVNHVIGKKKSAPQHADAPQETQSGNPISPRPERQDYADPEDRDNEDV